MDFVGFPMESIEYCDKVVQEDTRSPDGRVSDRSRSKEKSRLKRKREDSRGSDSRSSHREPRQKLPRNLDDSNALHEEPASGIPPAAWSAMVSQITSLVLSKVSSSVPGGVSASPTVADTSVGNVSVIVPEVHRTDDGIEQPYVFGQDNSADEELESVSVSGNSTFADLLGCIQPAGVSPTTQPLAHSLGVNVPSAGPSSLGSNNTLPDLGDAITDMNALFQQDDMCGVDLPSTLASALNDCLRKKPSETKIWELSDKIKWPTNVPHFQVPKMNPEVLHAMNPFVTKFDKRLSYLNVWISKAMAPIAAMLGDTGKDTGKTLNSYKSDLSDVLHLLIATFNFMNQVRKEHLRNTLGRRDQALSSLCTWETLVGEKSLFPFNVQTKCRDLSRAKKIGQPYYGRGRSSGGTYGRGQSRRGDFRPARRGFGRGARRGRN